MIVSRAKAEEAWRVIVDTVVVRDPNRIPDASTNVSLFGVHRDSLPTTEDIVNASYKMAAKLCHPDSEYPDPDLFVKVDWAKHALLKWIKQGGAPGDPDYKREDCVRCDGKGYTQSWLGHKRGPRVQCARCKGTGDADYEPDLNDGVTQ